MMNIDIQTQHTKVTVKLEPDTLTTFFEALIGLFTGEPVRRVQHRPARPLPQNDIRIAKTK